MEMFKDMAFFDIEKLSTYVSEKISAFQDPHFLLNTRCVLHENFIPIAMSIGEEIPTASNSLVGFLCTLRNAL